MLEVVAIALLILVVLRSLQKMLVRPHHGNTGAMRSLRLHLECDA